MSYWKATVHESESEEMWSTDIRAADEREALKKALDIFLHTEDREKVEFDYGTLRAEEANKLPNRQRTSF